MKAVQEYRYDSLNRLTLAAENSGATVTCPDTSSTWCQHYTYDAAGNRMIDQRSGDSALVWDTNSFSTATNRISDSHWKYDDAGRLTQDYLGETIAYDAENRQIAVCKRGDTCANPTQQAASRTLYVYDGEGQRVERIDVDSQQTATQTVFVYDVGGNLAAEYSSVGSSQSGTQYVMADHLGSTRLVMSGGQVNERHDYLPFGYELYPKPGNWRLGSGIVGYATDTVRQKFTGQERDVETTLDYFNARYFSPAQGRFTSPDPGNAGADPTDPQSWNGYAYVSNNPMNLTDPSGMGIFGDIGSIIGSFFPGLGTLIGWGIGSIADLATGQSISPPGLIGVGSDILAASQAV